MAVEIELKAWVDDVNAIKAALEREAVFAHDYIKNDCYWFAKNNGVLPLSGLRVRNETQTKAGSVKETVIVTYKTKETRNGIEVNYEEEFELCAGAASFELLLGKIGFARGYTKQKRGSLFCAGKINAELSFVEKLGFFIELEIISQTAGEAIVKKERAALLEFLAKLGISEKKIEPKYYSELLAGK
ncbi:MAG: CYTH domain-containing protein [Spirochaetaceae bacterium]|jgi:adenylate cyclase class 2|nr:CYTH domain-containing protein [Spirochaetaceae bacterium]